MDLPTEHIVADGGEIDSGTGIDPGGVIDALQHVISDIDEFAADWFQHLRTSLQVSEDGDSTLDAKLEAKFRHFQHEREEWTLQRDAELREIESKAGELTEAWLRLEDEQRKFLQMRDSHPHASRARAVTSESVRQESLETSADPSRLNGGSSRPSELAASPQQQNPEGDRSREAAVQQFQQLRREIESNRPGLGQL